MSISRAIYKTSLKITSLTLVFGSILSLFCAFAFGSSISFEIEGTYPDTMSIFLNNLRFIFVFLIPFLGTIYFLLSFGYIFSLIGVSAVNSGLLFTISRLIHVPLEVFSFSIPITLSILLGRKLMKQETDLTAKDTIFLLLISIILLFLSAVLENSLI